MPSSAIGAQVGTVRNECRDISFRDIDLDRASMKYFARGVMAGREPPASVPPEQLGKGYAAGKPLAQKLNDDTSHCDDSLSGAPVGGPAETCRATTTATF